MSRASSTPGSFLSSIIPVILLKALHLGPVDRPGDLPDIRCVQKSAPETVMLANRVVFKVEVHVHILDWSSSCDQGFPDPCG